MDLLFRREQTRGDWGRVIFKLWGKIELDEEEVALMERYRLDVAMLIAIEQPHLMRQSIVRGCLAFVLAYGLCLYFGIAGLALLVASVAGGGFAFWWYNESRETIFVNDLPRIPPN